MHDYVSTMNDDLLLCLLIGTVWGLTNTGIRLGVLQVQRKRQQRGIQIGWRAAVSELCCLLSTPAYLIPQALNYCGSAAFAWLQTRVPLALGGPVVNAVTLAATAVADRAVGEPLDLRLALPGVALVTLGAALCSSA